MVKPKDCQTTKLPWNFLPWLGASHRDSQVPIAPPLLPKPGQVSLMPTVYSKSCPLWAQVGSLRALSAARLLLWDPPLQSQSLVKEGQESMHGYLSSPAPGETILHCILWHSSEDLLRNWTLDGNLLINESFPKTFAPPSFIPMIIA